MATPCPLCADTGLDPRVGYAPPEDVLFIQERLPPSVITELAQALRSGDHVAITIDTPPNGGIPTVDLVRRKRWSGKKGA